MTLTSAQEIVPGRRYAVWYAGGGVKPYLGGIMLVEVVPLIVERRDHAVILSNVHTAAGDRTYVLRDTDPVFQVEDG